MRSFLEFAVEAAWEAGRITLAYFQTGLAIETKPDGSPVTVADRLAEEKLRSLIRARFPEHGILGEEMGRQEADSEYLWIIDPIDGTRSFARGVPLYGTLVGLEIGGEPALGVAYFPALGEMVYAARGEGCYWNGRRARVSEVRALEEALLLVTDMADIARYGRSAAYAKLQKATAYQRGWGDCYGHILVATGRAEIMLDPVVSVWDCAALLPILQEAGGTFTDWEGSPTIHVNDAISTNGHLFETVMEMIK
ncbi:MAG: histidinol-phosphatase [Anaerolineae bacterium]